MRTKLKLNLNWDIFNVLQMIVSERIGIEFWKNKTFKFEIFWLFQDTRSLPISMEEDIQVLQIIINKIKWWLFIWEKEIYVKTIIFWNKFNLILFCLVLSKPNFKLQNSKTYSINNKIGNGRYVGNKRFFFLFINFEQ